MTTQMSKVIQHLRSAVLREGSDLTDGQLLECFVRRREPAALEALVRRHGPMVWGVCRRILWNYHDVQDAFQATFLVLVRKAASVTPRDMVGNWLYGVAQHTALKAKATAAKQRTRERQVADMPDPAVKEQEFSGDLQTLLDQELNRLPDKYRVAIVLCDLEGVTRKEAARQLDLPEGTLAGRLTRGRVMLAKRLARQGLAVSGGTLAAMLAQESVSACVPISVMSSTIKTVTLVAAGKTAVTGLVSAKVAALTEGVLKAMLVKNLKVVMTVLFVMLGMVVFGGGLYLHHAEAQPRAADKPPIVNDKLPVAQEGAKAPQKQGKEKEGFTAWGREIGGLQAGLGYRPGEKRAYKHGETITLVVRIRNVGKEEVKFQYLRQFFIENPPTVTDGEGKTVSIEGVAKASGQFHKPVDVALATGKEIELYELKRELRPPSEANKLVEPDTVERLWASGKVGIRYERVFGNSSSGTIELDPTLTKLSTGTLELEIKSDQPPEKGKKQDKEKEGFTAWGKEIGNLQAGLGFRPGEKRAYGHGETVTLVVRVRNVGKKEVEFQYLKEFFKENPPIVADADGKKLPGYKILYTPLEHVPEEVSLAPGKEIELSSEQYQLMPTNEREKGHSGRFLPLWMGTGKVSVQYNRLFGNTSAGRIKVDPDLLDLTTGSLKLEIKPAKTEKK